MYVHRSNSLEALLDALAGIVRTPCGDVLARECIVVHDRALERWTACELATRLGIWANHDFPFPRRFVDRVARTFWPGKLASDPFDPRSLVWSILDLLPQVAQRSDAAQLRAYLEIDTGPGRFELAKALAELFDRYVVYRPELVMSWESRLKAPDWQAALWRDLIARHGSTHMAARMRAVIEALRGKQPELGDMPRRVSVFGVVTLAPIYLELFAALARHVEVHLFVVSPCREYWADVAPQNARPEQISLFSQAENPLLARLGGLGRNFHSLLEELQYREQGELYREPMGSDMLRELQADMLSLRRRDIARTYTTARGAIDTLEVHVCHGPLQELELVRDRIFSLLDDIPDLQLHEIAVMCPALDRYARVIEAVFGTQAERHIPFTMVDGSDRARSPVVAGFAELLELVSGRLGASEVLDMLGNEAIRAKLGLTNRDLDLIREWVGEANVRWGADERHRAEHGQPAVAANTWRFGLDRLLLGLVATPHTASPFGGVFPCDISRGERQTLARFVGFVEQLLELRREVVQPRVGSAWRDVLLRLLTTMLSRSAATADYDAIHEAIETLIEAIETAGHRSPIPFRDLRNELLRLMNQVHSSSVVPEGVTVCGFGPIRCIPFRVSFLVGLDHDTFPRSSSTLAFDKIATAPRIGDRNVRDDDRYAFLSALVSTSERFIVTYTGHDIHDGSVVLPSIIVEELIDVVAATCSDHQDIEQAKAELRARIVVHHPLRRHDPRYFDGHDVRLCSHDPLLAAAASACGSVVELEPFLDRILVEDPNHEWIDLEHFVEFFRDPAKMFARDRLGIDLAQVRAGVADREPLWLEPLERWKLGDELLHVPASSEVSAFELLRTAGALPYGNIGKAAFAQVWPTVRVILQAARPWLERAIDDPRDVALTLTNGSIRGVLRGLRAGTAFRMQFSRVAGPAELTMWIRHLIACALSDHIHESVVVGRDEGYGAASVAFGHVSRELATSYLERLLSIYRDGRTRALPLFPGISRAHVEQGSRPDGIPARRREIREWLDKPEGRYAAKLFERADPLAPHPGGPNDTDHGFHHLASSVYEPMLAHRREVLS